MTSITNEKKKIFCHGEPQLRTFGHIFWNVLKDLVKRYP